MELIGKTEGGRRHGGAEGRCASMEGMKWRHGESGSRVQKGDVLGQGFLFFFLFKVWRAC
jgi:hypothetical protein